MADNPNPPLYLKKWRTALFSYSVRLRNPVQLSPVGVNPVQLSPVGVKYMSAALRD